MEEQCATLFNSAAHTVVSEVAKNKNPSALLNTLPHEVATVVVNTPLTEKGATLATFYVAQANKHRETSLVVTDVKRSYKQQCKVLKWLKKFEFILDKGFTNVNTYDEIPLAHSLVRFCDNPLALGLLWRIITVGACLNTPHINNNVLEDAINFQNFDAVKMITEETMATVNLERADSLLPCLIKSIELYKNEKKMYRYLDKHIPLYKQRSNNRYVIAPCCEKRHEPYYPQDIFV